MPDPLDAIALVYDNDAYRETTRRPPERSAGSRAGGLMGRQVAGKGFLEALLEHGRWSTLAALVANPQAAASIQEVWNGQSLEKSRKRLRVLDWQKGWDAFLGNDPPAR